MLLWGIIVCVQQFHLLSGRWCLICWAMYVCTCLIHTEILSLDTIISVGIPAEEFEEFIWCKAFFLIVERKPTSLNHTMPGIPNAMEGPWELAEFGKKLSRGFHGKLHPCHPKDLPRIITGLALYVVFTWVGIPTLQVSKLSKDAYNINKLIFSINFVKFYCRFQYK